MPTLPLHDNVAVPEEPSVTLVGLREHRRPVAGDVVAARETVPVNPLTAVTVTVEVPMAPALTVTVVGLAVTVKSVTVKVTVAVCDIAPLVPVTVTV